MKVEGKSDRRCCLTAQRLYSSPSSRVKHEIASELHPQGGQTSEGFGCCSQVLPLTNVKLCIIHIDIGGGEMWLQMGIFK